MRRLISAGCGLILGAAVICAGALPAAAQAALQGNWTATKAERDGAVAAEVVGNRLSVSGDRFEIKSKDGKALYAGTVRTEPNAKPAAIDFAHTQGALGGKTWKGIYRRNGDRLIVCDNAADPTKGRPAAFATRRGSGYVLVTFARTK